MGMEAITLASVVILDRSESFYVVGIDMSHIREDLETYDTVSLVLNKDEYASVNQVLIRVFIEVFKRVPDEDIGVCFRGRIPPFKSYYRKLTCKAKVHAAGRNVSFRFLNANPSRAVKIAVEAMKLAETGGNTHEN